MNQHLTYILNQTKSLLAIHSPTGYTQEAATYVMNELINLGYTPTQTVKGGVVVDLGGKDENNAILLEAHLDTLGAMVAEIKSNGRLRIVPVGGLNANNVEAENCSICTKFSGEYEGTYQLVDASVHVNKDYSSTTRSFDVMEVVLDEVVKTAEDVKKLGIRIGDFVCFDTRTKVTTQGYIKSRFLDDKLSVGILLGYAKHLKEENVTPERKVYLHITVYEEVGHGGAASVPKGVTEAISVDMGCVGNGLDCDEHMVSICAKDSMGPYSYDVVKGLIAAAEAAEVKYAVDLYPFYGSDVDVTLKAGHDIKHGLIGPGVYASHGYERSHTDGVLNTLKLIDAYIK